MGFSRGNDRGDGLDWARAELLNRLEHLTDQRKAEQAPGNAPDPNRWATRDSITLTARKVVRTPYETRYVCDGFVVTACHESSDVIDDLRAFCSEWNRMVRR